MAHRKIGGGSNEPKEPRKLAKDTPMKPLVRVYLKENPTCQGKEFPVLSGRLTTQGWFILECKEFVFLFPGGSELGHCLFDDVFPTIHGKEAKQMLIIPDKSEKLYGYIGMDDEKRIKYHWDAENYNLFIGQEPPAEKGGSLPTGKDFL